MRAPRASDAKSRAGPLPYAHLFEDEEGEADTAAPPQKEIEEMERALAKAKATGNSLFEEGMFDDACAAYKRGLEIFEDSGGHLLKSPAGAQVQRLAIALYCNAAQGLLKCAGSRNSRASCSHAMATKALALEPRNAKALFRRGLANAFQEDWQKAIEDFNVVLELEPGSDAARRELEKAQEHRHGPIPAPKCPDKHASVMADAEDEKAKGTRLFMEGKYYEAYEAWQEGINALSVISPDEMTMETQRVMVALCNNSAQALLQIPEVDASSELALAMTNKALELEPSNIKALFRRGCAYVNAERWHSATRDFEHVLKLEPDMAAAQQELDKIQALGYRSPPDQESLDLRDPDAVSRMAQREADKFKREILAVADGHGSVPKWCQRFNKMQVEAAAWAKHQLADPEALQDMITLRGPVFAAMNEQQKEDFIAACEFMSDARAQYGGEIDQLLAAASARG